MDLSQFTYLIVENLVQLIIPIWYNGDMVNINHTCKEHGAGKYHDDAETGEHVV